jgi:hypothetical protein
MSSAMRRSRASINPGIASPCIAILSMGPRPCMSCAPVSSAAVLEVRSAPGGGVVTTLWRSGVGGHATSVTTKAKIAAICG